MIYNLAKYIETQFPTETIYRNTKTIQNVQVPDRIIIIMETGGEKTNWFGWRIQTVQIITRDIDTPKAKKLAEDIYNEIHDRYGLVLPDETVDGDLYQGFQANQITAIALPQSLGFDENGRAEFTTNYQIYYRKEVR